ncbi:uncharacterized protein LOC119769242 [Culex quinquefasciatus]|uniref:uncharacterized protein LOC119769242 n=1 Tax=Culex quinquefasciatus TaxID=7176 RepID=UPI0018E2B111|nr:uncharacterized protein LOC119769242 [Culex quinquefasciatus]
MHISLWSAVLLLALGVGPSSQRGVNYEKTSQLSHFKGVIAPTDTQCFNFFIEKKTQLPLTVPVVTNLPLSAIKATAWEFNKVGFTMDVQVGGLGATTTVLKFHGSEKTRYAIEVECYCTAAAAPPALAPAPALVVPAPEPVPPPVAVP